MALVTVKCGDGDDVDADCGGGGGEHGAGDS